MYPWYWMCRSKQSIWSPSSLLNHPPQPCLPPCGGRDCTVKERSMCHSWVELGELIVFILDSKSPNLNPLQCISRCTCDPQIIWEELLPRPERIREERGFPKHGRQAQREHSTLWASYCIQEHRTGSWEEAAPRPDTITCESHFITFVIWKVREWEPDSLRCGQENKELTG